MNRIRGHMKKSERAKQFLAFSALKGLDRQLAEAEYESCPPCELLEDEAEQLNRKLCILKAGDEVKVRHYLDGRYVTTCGKIFKIDYIYNTLNVGGKLIKTAHITDISLML